MHASGRSDVGTLHGAGTRRLATRLRARFAPSVPSAVLLVPAGAILAWASVAEEALRGLGRPTIVLIAELVAALVTVAALPLLLHTYGILGAAVASLLGYSTIAIFTVCVISRSTHQPVLRLIFPRRAYQVTDRTEHLPAAWVAPREGAS